MNLRDRLLKKRFGPVALIYLMVLSTGLLTRLILFGYSFANLELYWYTVPSIFCIGFFYDWIVASFFSLPVVLFILLMKDSWYQKKWVKAPLYFYFFLVILILTINVAGEIIFWDEFGVRYNFIAVDYLVYTNEVIGNIFESYNMPVLLAVIFIVVVGILWFISQFIRLSADNSLRFGKRLVFSALYLVMTTALYFGVSNRYKEFSNNTFVNELSGAGIYEFGAAYWHNEIDYEKFYATADPMQNFQIVRETLQQPNSRFLFDSLSIAREISSDSAEKKYNIVLISVESLSADYLKHFGSTENVTPYLDSLIPHSLFFQNFYATGTRTVRGLEALSLAIAPTPGQSIVRRPNNENLSTIGSVLNKKGYDVRYVYGGNSFFDNMGYFFGHNGYQVLDIRDIPSQNIHHETAWGAADEDGFGLLMQQCDKSFLNGKPFFNHIMTVSNHRPYTYPDGRIDIPSSSKSRQGAVKYTDYCINQFIQQAKQKPWFNQTIFVVVADHCAKSAGKTDLPVNRYHIPCLVYAPSIVKPNLENRLSSQMDLAPTILGMLNLHYTSKFMGRDIFKITKGDERIFISTYQDMGYIKNDTMVILSPKKKIKMYKVDFTSGVNTEIKLQSQNVAEAIAWYQSASYLFKSGGYLE